MAYRTWKYQDGQVHFVIGDIYHVLIGFDPLNAFFSGAYRIDNSGEVCFKDIVKDVVGYGTFYFIGTNNSNRFRMKNRFQVFWRSLFNSSIGL